jgi:hypothetical protein
VQKITIMTQFTINTEAANAQSRKLFEMGATVFAQHETKPNGMSTGVIDWGWGDQSPREVKEALPAAMTFMVQQTISRTALIKIFGKAAMVRGVKQV